MCLEILRTRINATTPLQISLQSAPENLRENFELASYSEKIFNYVSTPSMRRCFERQRKRIAYKIGNPRLLLITFKTLRHWKATMEYNRTKDILHVKNLLGHKRIENTLKYTQLINVTNEEYSSRVARTIADACKFVEAGFEYVCDIDGDKLFRKRK